jgi:hypothetical protein
MLTTGQYCYRRGEGCWESTTSSYRRTQLGALEACIFQQTETSQDEEISSIVPLVLDHVLKSPIDKFCRLNIIRQDSWKLFNLGHFN